MSVATCQAATLELLAVRSVSARLRATQAGTAVIEGPASDRRAALEVIVGLPQVSAAGVVLRARALVQNRSQPTKGPGAVEMLRPFGRRTDTDTRGFVPHPHSRVRRIDMLPPRTAGASRPNLQVAWIESCCFARAQRLVKAHSCEPTLAITAASSRTPSDQDVRADLVTNHRRDIALHVELHRAGRSWLALRHDLAQHQTRRSAVAGQSLRQQSNEPPNLQRSGPSGDLKRPGAHFFTVSSGWMLATRSASSASSRLAMTGSIGLYASGCSS